MNVKYINPFVVAAQQVFASFLQTEARPGKPYLLTEDSSSGNGWSISGIIGLAGQVIGVVIISFPNTTALKLTAVLTGESTAIIDDTVVDMVGEVVNIIAGNAKKDMEEFQIAISLPSVVKGPNHSFPRVGGTPLVAIPFTSDKGDFRVLVSMKDLI